MLGWKPLMVSWLKTLNPTFPDNCKNYLERLMLRNIPPMLAWLRKKAKELSPTNDTNVAVSFMRFVECHLKTICPTEDEMAATAAAVAKGSIEEDKVQKLLKDMSERDQLSWIEGIFVFAATWSFGGTCDSNSRSQFDKLIREITDGPISGDSKDKYGIIFDVETPEKSLTVPIPRNADVYSWQWITDSGTGRWEKWAEAMKNAPQLTENMNINQIIVPTQVSFRQD